MKKTTIFMTLLIFGISLFAVSSALVDNADARSRSGGRSFSRSSSPPPIRRSTPPHVPGSSRSTQTNRTGGSSFMRGMAGGLMGGMLGSMLFGGMAHGMGGGIGGSGFGLFDILIIGGIIYFIYTRFVKKKSAAMNGSGSNSFRSPHSSTQHSGSMEPPYTGGLDAPSAPGQPAQAPPPPPSFNEEEIKELAQDIFFRIQAAWMHRDIDVIKDLAGPELAASYAEEFKKMKEAGRVNRLENIAVRNVEILDHGIDDGHEFIRIKFTANLLDYTVDEASGDVIEGDTINPVKFQEIWTIARPSGSSRWLLYGIED